MATYENQLLTSRLNSVWVAWGQKFAAWRLCAGVETSTRPRGLTMRRNFKPWLAAVVLAAITPVATAQGSAASSTLGQENALLKKEVASLRQQLQQQDTNCRPPATPAKAKTLEQWHELLVGKQDRSQVIRMLGAPGKAMSGFLWYENLVLDPDTGESHTLQIAFLNATISSSGKVTHVTFI